jgi:hypothetical protein
MGRPIKEKFFGNTNSPYSNQAVGGTTGLGGEGMGTTITVTNTGTRYSQGAVALFSAAQLPGGIRATGTLTIGTPTTQGRITAVTLANAGSGYTSTATISITTASSVTKTASGTSTETTLHLNNVTGIYVGMTVTGSTGLGNGNSAFITAIDSATNSVTVSAANDGAISAATLTFADYGSGFTAVIPALTASQQNAIKGQAYLLAKDGGVSAKLYDIKKQEASKRYLVNTADGRGQCKLVTTSTLAAGEMNIEATDWNGSKYYVKKLTARRAVLVQTTATGSFLIADGASTGWTLGSSTGTIVSIGNN